MGRSATAGERVAGVNLRWFRYAPVLSALLVAGCSDRSMPAAERSAARVAVVPARAAPVDPTEPASLPHEVVALPVSLPSSTPSREPDDGLYVPEPPGTQAVIPADLSSVVSPANQLPPPGIEESLAPENIVDVHRGE